MAVFASVLLLLTASAAADPTPTVLHFSSNSTVYTDTNPGEGLRLPPGYYLPEDSWKILDDEFKRLQDQETRLGAENKSLRETSDSWQPGWKTLTVTLLTGMVAGWYIHQSL